MARTVVPLWKSVPPERRDAAARQLYADFDALRRAGFSREEALRIVIAIITS